MFVIIPAFRAPQKLERCLAAIRSQTLPCRVFVHDNSEQNLGFTAAVNLGLREALRSGEEFALILNQDVYMRPDSAEKLTAFMRSHRRCAIAGVKQVHDRDPDLIVHGGCGAAFPYGQHVHGRKSRGDCAVSLPMPWVNGAILGARLEAVVDFGLMDHNMFLIGSDSDWCYSARLRQWEVWYCAECEVIHEGGITTGPPPEEFQGVYLKDMTYWRDKWVGTKVFERLRNWSPTGTSRPPQPAAAAPA